MLTRPHFSEHAAFGLRTLEDDMFLPRPFVSSAGKQMAEPHAQERALCHARAQGRGKREHDLYTDIGAREFHRGFVSV